MCVCVCVCVCVYAPTLLTDPLDCSPPGSSIHGILQARILEWVAIPVSWGSSQPRDRTQVSYVCITGQFFTTEPPGKPIYLIRNLYSKYVKNSSKPKKKNKKRERKERKKIE